MSKQAFERSKAVYAEYDTVLKNAESTVANLVTHTNEALLYVIFLHHNLLNNLGDLSEGDRLDFRARIMPLYPKIQTVLETIGSIATIHNDDPLVWQANFDAYVAANPEVYVEALSRFPQVV
jgi:hypothetical protein